MSSEIEPQLDLTQLMVKFVTKSQRFSVPDYPYSILASSNSNNLNSLIKNILREDLSNKSENEITDLDSAEFDFYVNGVFLDATLHDLIKSTADIKTESIIEIEYTERNPPPEPIDTLTVDDWISSIRGFDKYILLGCYDNTVQLWNTDGKLLTSLNVHTGAVKAVCWSKLPNNEDDALCFISASHDQSLIVWHLSKDKNSLVRLEKCVGHTVSVECVDVNSENNKFVSGSWDKTLKLWDLEESVIGESVNKKKKSDANNFTVKTPIITLAGHNENISSCRWIDTKTVCTGSWDHSIKLWDVYVGQETRTLKSPSSKIFLSLDYSPVNNLIAAGLNDSVVRIYDPKSNEGNLVKISLNSHAGWCSSVAWSPTNEHLLVSGSYDNEAKLWDIRNTKSSLYDLLGHEDKVLCVDWSINNLILTGSADNTFKMFRT